MTTAQQPGVQTPEPFAPRTPTTYRPVLDDDAPPAVPRGALGRPSPDERFARVGSWAGGLDVVNHKDV